jgi:hypothetical protein
MEFNIMFINARNLQRFWMKLQTITISLNNNKWIINEQADSYDKILKTIDVIIFGWHVDL